MKKSHLFLSLVYLIVMTVFSCKPEDYYYGQYIGNGEIYYPGRIDSLSILPGNQRAILRFRVTTDPKITSLKVYLRSSLSAEQTVSSYTVAAGEHGEIRTIELADLFEATYTADVYTFVPEGDSSRAVTASQFIYGENYRSTLSNRPFSTINKADPEEHFVVFARESNLPDEDVFYRMQFTEVLYTNADGGTTTVTLTPYEEFVSIAGAVLGTTIRYRTAYKPVETSIDLFYTDYNEILYE